MSTLAIDDMFYGKPERVRYVTGGGGGYGRYQAGPHYYSDGDDYYSHRQSGHSGHSGRAPVYSTSVSGRPMLPDVRMSVPLDSSRCVEKVKEALDISGVYSVHCDVPSQTVTVSGNVAPQALLKRVKHVKRKAKILSYTSLYTDSGHIGSHHGRTSSSSITYGTPGYGSSAYGSSYYRSGRMPSPPRDHSYYSRNNQHTFARPGGYNDQYRPSHDHHYTNYY